MTLRRGSLCAKARGGSAASFPVLFALTRIHRGRLRHRCAPERDGSPSRSLCGLPGQVPSEKPRWGQTFSVDERFWPGMASPGRACGSLCTDRIGRFHQSCMLASVCRSAVESSCKSSTPASNAGACERFRPPNGAVARETARLDWARSGTSGYGAV